jgi:prepilin-type N-terminal cleavage/methylation domain-containing protein
MGNLVNNNIKSRNGYSLIEVMVSLAIIGFVLTILFNVVITALQITIKSMARSFTREEVATVMNLIEKDIKNADWIEVNGSNYEFSVDGVKSIWSICQTDRVCRYVNGVQDPAFITSQNIQITAFELTEGYDVTSGLSGGSYSKKNILVTIVANHSNTVFNITNVLRQETISTRNYEF